MKRQKEYLPLQIVREYRTNKESSMLDTIKTYGWLPNKISDDEIIDFVFSKSFMSKKYHGKFLGLNCMIEYGARNGAEEDFFPIKHNRDRKTDWRDMLIIGYAILKWAEYKQSYKINADFFEELAQTKNITIHHDFANYLPVPDMYIDLSEIQGISPIEGAFIHTFRSEDGDQAAIYMVTDEHLIFSFYSNFYYDEDGLFYMSDDFIPSSKFMAILIDDDLSVKQRNFENDSRAIICKAIIQILLFLSADKSDIQENPVTKKTYKKPSVIRDKFSEVRIWDVGVRYGKAIRVAKEEIRKEQEKSADTDRDEAARTVHIRKQPRPHVRCAHWHRYHVGKGRTEIRINWIPPVFVCKGKEIPVVIHNIK